MPLSLSIVLLHAVLGWMLLLLVFRLARPVEATERAPSVWVPAAGALFFAPAAALAWFAGPELPTLGAALAGGLLFVVLLRLKGTGSRGRSGHWRVLLAAALPYLLVLLLILATRLIPPLAALLRGVEVTWQMGDEFGGSIAPLYHPGTMLFVALIASAAVASHRDGALRASLFAAAGRMPPVALALVAVLLLARLMIQSGMFETLALSASGHLAANWLLVAPLVGALGSFVTGSATASNIILAEFQTTAAATVGLAPLLVLAGQGFGAAIGNIIAPHNIVAGAATVGLVGREGEVLKRTLPVCLGYALLGGALLVAVGRSF